MQRARSGRRGTPNAHSPAGRYGCAWACTPARPSRTDEGYVGLDVLQAARICAMRMAARWSSDRTRRLLEPAAEVSDLGLHRLKDIPEPERLYQLGSEAFHHCAR